MYKYLIKILLTLGSFFWVLPDSSAASTFSYAEINVPFEVQVDGTWVEIIETQQEWEAFYTENAVKYVGPDSDLGTPPEFDFDSYVVVAGGLGAGSAARSLMIERVDGLGATTYLSALILQMVGCNVIDAVTYPTIVILIPKPEDDLQIISKEATFNCGQRG